ncbi:nucleotide-binding protein [Subtercola frigoramans]|uniref:MinD-like ATPase involved in chromosome partitioning or flagellar assembly n=1 Tax=Subtercola frigoramans TaxID=120298 RepID=A0ABS2L0F6_9MICO|nr:hypothetical protein [Subtercola frigoramans]MBM7470547.1 MinD-like ATPase involved in chromosome partitioning or flagellar assembly [Subtercola frigoramans]
MTENVRTVHVFPGASSADEYTEDDFTPHDHPTPHVAPASELTAPEDVSTSEFADEVPRSADTDGSAAVRSSIFDNPAAGLTAAAHTPTVPAATTGVRGLLSRLGIRMAPSAHELAELGRADARRQDETVVRQATWTRAVSVLVANPKGGTGKTPTALILGGVLASIRGGSVAVVEVADDPGALTFRAEGNPALGLGDLMRDVDQITNAGQLAGYTAPQTSFAAVIGSTGRRPRLTGEAVVDISRVIDEFYAIRVMDSGNQPTSSAFQGAVSVADALVIPVMNAGDSTLEAIRLLTELRAAGGPAAALANRAIAIRLIDGRPENAAVTDEVTRLLTEAGISTIHDIPYDRHIAERGQITLATLTPATADAFTSAAATVVKTLQTAARTTTNTRKVSA